MLNKVYVCMCVCKDAVEKIRRPTFFLSGDKILCFLTAIPRRVILFRERGQIIVPLIDVLSRASVSFAVFIKEMLQSGMS